MFTFVKNCVPFYRESLIANFSAYYNAILIYIYINYTKLGICTQYARVNVSDI